MTSIKLHGKQAGSESCTIPVQGLSSGMYMLRVRMNNEVFIEKVIVN
ncbi:MAG: T9SS type A sorting domain-containing protein [Ignavibacteria bacterium]